MSGFADLISTQLAIHELELQEELAARAEVRALQAQINPHFLLLALSPTTSAPFSAARELLREFSSFYRSTLDNSGSLIPVSREIAQTKRYLMFEYARFGDDRIAAEFIVEDGVEESPVPSFVIQPLVENAVRHGMKDEGTLHIRVAVRSCGEGAISIEVSDDGVGMSEQRADRGAPFRGNGAAGRCKRSPRRRRWRGHAQHLRANPAILRPQLLCAR